MRRLCVVFVLVLAGCFNNAKHEPSRQAVDLNNHAFQAFRHGDLSRALLLVNDAINLDPEFAGAYVNKAAILEKLGQRAEAVAALETLVRLNPSGGDGYVALGVVLEKMGRADEARENYEKALKLFTEQSARAKPEEQAALEVNRAAAQYLAGDDRGAMATLDRLLAANPTLETAKVYKQRIETGRREVFLNGPE